MKQRLGLMTSSSQALAFFMFRKIAFLTSVLSQKL
jgi:hypothetical protein